jgi:hypothetical protein
MRDLQILADKFAIANTLALHSRGVDRGDYALLRSAYAPDGEVAYGFFNGPADDFARILTGAQRSGPVTLHRTSNIWVQVEDKRARSESYVVAFTETPADQGGGQRLIGGRYLDRHARGPDGWKISHRTYVLDWNVNWPGVSAWPEPDDAHFAPRGGHGMADAGRVLLAAWSARASQQHGDHRGMNDQDEATLDTLLSKQAIHELGMAYCRAVDRGDEEALRSLFHPDASIVSGVVNGGVDVFAPAMVGLVTGMLKSSFHSVANEWVKITGDSAVGESYVTAFTLAGEGSSATQTISGGRYLDRFDRRNGQWKFSERVFVMDFNINQPSTAIFDAGPYESLKLRGGFKPLDPVYMFWN